MAEANALVRRWHRRHGGVQGYKLALAAVLEAERVAREDAALYSYRRDGRTGRYVGIVGRPA